jgi:hypothetical protein
LQPVVSITKREEDGNRSYVGDGTWKDSVPPYTVFVASTKKYDFVRRAEGP